MNLIRASNQNLHKRYKKQYKQNELEDYLPVSVKKITGIRQARFWLKVLKDMKEYNLHSLTGKKAQHIIYLNMLQWFNQEKQYIADTDEEVKITIDKLKGYIDMEAVILHKIGRANEQDESAP